jgi:hypothetical protein
MEVFLPTPRISAAASRDSEPGERWTFEIDLADPAVQRNATVPLAGRGGRCSALPDEPVAGGDDIPAARTKSGNPVPALERNESRPGRRPDPAAISRSAGRSPPPPFAVPDGPVAWGVRNRIVTVRSICSGRAGRRSSGGVFPVSRPATTSGTSRSSPFAVAFRRRTGSSVGPRTRCSIAARRKGHNATARPTRITRTEARSRSSGGTIRMADGISVSERRRSDQGGTRGSNSTPKGTTEHRGAIAAFLAFRMEAPDAAAKGGLQGAPHDRRCGNHGPARSLRRQRAVDVGMKNRRKD